MTASYGTADDLRTLQARLIPCNQRRVARPCEPWGQKLTLTGLLWLATACYGVHILEEYQLDWRNWARSALKLPVEWTDFYVVNALVVILGIVAANLAAWPAIALAFPALMLINATFFHVLPFACAAGSRPDFSPPSCCSIPSASPATCTRRAMACSVLQR